MLAVDHRNDGVLKTHAEELLVEVKMLEGKEKDGLCSDK
jgi:hypothetical protein